MRDSVEHDLEWDPEVDNGVNLTTHSGQDRAKLSRLIHGPWKTIQDGPLAGIRLVQAFSNDLRHGVIWYQLSSIEKRAGNRAERLASSDGFPKQGAGRDMGEPQALGDELGLGAFSRGGRSHHDNDHLT
jgi:hypothetical protein